MSKNVNCGYFVIGRGTASAPPLRESCRARGSDDVAEVPHHPHLAVVGKGPRIYDWAAGSFGVPIEHERGPMRRWLPVRRSMIDPDDRAYYLCAAPPAAGGHDLAIAAGQRWAIETCFQTAKQEAGLDEYEVRSWTGWYRHVTLSMLALAFLAAVRSQASQSSKKGDLHWSPDRAGDPPTDARHRLATPERHRTHTRLVPLATTSPSHHATVPLPGTSASLSSATVVLGDHFSRESLVIAVDRSLSADRVVEVLDQVGRRQGLPQSIRVDNGPEFTSRRLDQWAYLHKVELDFSRPGKPTDNAFIESFNGRLRQECLNVNWFLSLANAREKVEA